MKNIFIKLSFPAIITILMVNCAVKKTEISTNSDIDKIENKNIEKFIDPSQEGSIYRAQEMGG